MILAACFNLPSTVQATSAWPAPHKRESTSSKCIKSTKLGVSTVKVDPDVVKVTKTVNVGTIDDLRLHKSYDVYVKCLALAVRRS